MSNNRRNGTARQDFLVILSFIVLIVAAVIWLILAIARLADIDAIIGSRIIQTANFLVNLGLVICISLAAYPFARSRRSSVWWLIYWIIVIVALIGALFGIVHIFP